MIRKCEGVSKVLTICTRSHPQTERLVEEIASMGLLGPPVIRGIDCGAFYLALDTVHQVAAAHALGLTPALDVVGEFDEVEVSEFHWYRPEHWDRKTAFPAHEVAQRLVSPRSVFYTFVPAATA